MFSYGKQEDQAPQPDLEQTRPQMPEGHQPMSDSEKSTLMTRLDACAYPRRKNALAFRRDLGPREFLFRALSMLVIWAWAHYSHANSAKGRMDQQWLETFALLMILFFVIMHAFAYMGTGLYSGIADCLRPIFGGVENAYQNMRDYHYCAALMLFIVIMYPIITFVQLVLDGFHPYSSLTKEQLAEPRSGLGATVVTTFRTVLHLFTIALVVHTIAMLIIMVLIRNWSRYPGNYVWLAKFISGLPYGAFFFEEGENFDCGICLNGIWKGEDVVALTCNERHVYHADCLRKQVSVFSQKYCVLCDQALPMPVEPKDPPALEVADINAEPTAQ